VRIPREQIKVKRYAIDTPPAPARVETPLRLTLLVAPFQADARQKGERINYRDEVHGMDYYYYHRWIVSPAQMLGDALAEHILNWGICRSIVRTEVGIVPTHELHGRLISLYADNIKNQESAHFEATLTLLRVDPKTYERETIFQKDYPIVVPRKNKRIESYVEAVNQAVAEWFTQVREDLEPILREEESRLVVAK